MWCFQLRVLLAAFATEAITISAEGHVDDAACPASAALLLQKERQAPTKTELENLDLANSQASVGQTLPSAAPEKLNFRSLVSFVVDKAQEAGGVVLAGHHHSSPPPKALELLGRAAQVVAGLAIVVTVLRFACVGLPAKRPCELSTRNDEAEMPGLVLLFICLFVALELSCTDQYAPSLPDITLDLGASHEEISGTLQINWFTKGCATLFMGPLSDYIGRKPVVIGGCCLLIVSTFCCGCATTYQWFLFGRVLQGLGEAVDVVLIAMVRDYVPNEEKRFRVGAQVGAFLTVGPVLAPSAGGLMASWLGWRSTFYFLSACMALLAAFGASVVKESSPDRETMDPVEDARVVLSNGHLVSLMVVELFVNSIVGAMLANASFVLQGEYGMSVVASSLAMSLFAAASLAGVLLSQAFPGVPLLRRAQVAFGLQAVPLTVWTVAGLFFMDSLWVYVWSTAFAYMMSVGLVGVMVGTLYMQPVEHVAGMAASLKMSMIWCMGSLLSALATYNYVHFAARGLVFTQASFIVIATVLFWFGFGAAPPEWACQDPKSKSDGELDSTTD